MRNHFVAFLTSLLIVVSQGRLSRKKRELIRGGEESEYGEFPYFVDLGSCGGSLIASNVVLTAAHCGSYLQQSVIVGGFHRGETYGRARRIKVINEALHPEWTNHKTEAYDFQLLRLEEPVVLRTRIVLELNEDELTPVVGQNLTVMGLGSTSVLNDVVVQSVDFRECFNKHSQDWEIDPDKLKDSIPFFESIMLCAGKEGGGKYSCGDDSGGPLVIRSGDVHTQVGIASWRRQGCGADYDEGVYSRVSGAINWIKSIVCTCWSSSESSFCDDFESTNNTAICPTPPRTKSCEKLEGFVDEFGDNCDWYVENESSGCPIFGNIKGGPGFENATAKEACCHCVEDSSPLFTDGASDRSNECKDISGFQDVFNDSCDWYESHEIVGCPIFGHTAGTIGGTTNEIIASEACCFCNGGLFIQASDANQPISINPTPSPSEIASGHPTSDPTSSPTSKPTASPTTRPTPSPLSAMPSFMPSTRDRKSPSTSSLFVMPDRKGPPLVSKNDQRLDINTHAVNGKQGKVRGLAQSLSRQSPSEASD